jgi:hypothetical protein
MQVTMRVGNSRISPLIIMDFSSFSYTDFPPGTPAFFVVREGRFITKKPCSHLANKQLPNSNGIILKSEQSTLRQAGGEDKHLGGATQL